MRWLSKAMGSSRDGRSTGRRSTRAGISGEVAGLALAAVDRMGAGRGRGTASVTDFSVSISGSRAHYRDFVEVAAGGVDITTADFLLSIGRGIGDKENIPMFEQLAAEMGAVLSVSRPLVDGGWMPSKRQVGQSGKTVKPKAYLALGISGVVQHLAGMKAS